MNTYNEYANQIIDELKPTFEQVSDIGKHIKVHPNKLDKIFYLSMEDDLSELYERVLEKYLTVKGKANEAEAVTLLALKEIHKSEKITQKILDAETRVEIKDIVTVENILESWVKTVKNYLATTRSHVSAITGKEDGSDE